MQTDPTGISEPTSGGVTPADFAALVGGRLRSARKAKSMTLRDAATPAEVSVAHLSQVENGKSIPGLLVASRLAALYGIGLASLIAAEGQSQ